MRELLDATQDDDGVLVRMTRPSHDRRNMNSRASSQPRPQRKRRSQHRVPFRSYLHPWLPAIHLCHASFTYVLDKHAVTNRSGEHDWLVDVKTCARGENVSHPFQTPFCGIVDAIKICQAGDIPPDHFDPYRRNNNIHPSLRHDKSGGQCSQGCTSVDIDKLRVPASLPEWHPGHLRGRSR